MTSRGGSWLDPFGVPIEKDGVILPARRKIKLGNGLTAVDNPDNDSTDLDAGAAGGTRSLFWSPVAFAIVNHGSSPITLVSMLAGDRTTSAWFSVLKTMTVYGVRFGWAANGDNVEVSLRLPDEAIVLASKTAEVSGLISDQPVDFYFDDPFVLDRESGTWNRPLCVTVRDTAGVHYAQWDFDVEVHNGYQPNPVDVATNKAAPFIGGDGFVWYRFDLATNDGDSGSNPDIGQLRTGSGGTEAAFFPIEPILSPPGS